MTNNKEYKIISVRFIQGYTKFSPITYDYLIPSDMLPSDIVMDVRTSTQDANNSVVLMHKYIIESNTRCYDNPVVIEGIRNVDEHGLVEIIKIKEVFGNILHTISNNAVYELMPYSKTAVINNIESSENNKRKENSIMNTNNIFGKFEFGKVKTNALKMSIFGPAFKSAEGDYVAYDKKNNEYVNAEGFTIDGENYCYKMPVALANIENGDIIMHNNNPCRVTKIYSDENKIKAEDIYSKEEKVILPTKSPFGFNFFTKIMCLFDNMMCADSDNPFGNPMMMMMLANGGNMNDMLLPMVMMQNGDMDFSSNPMIMYLLMNNDSSDNMLPLMMMMNCKSKNEE